MNSSKGLWNTNSPSERRTYSSSNTAIGVTDADVHAPALIRRATALLEAEAIDSPRLCAEILLAHALDCERIGLYANSRTPLPADAVLKFEDLLFRRAQHEPIQYLVGSTELWSVSVRCDTRAFIPRPETELIVAEALRLCRAKRAPLIADIGTGTGCIALALAHEMPAAHVYASDTSPKALQLAAANVAEHGLERRIELLEGDLAAPFLARGMAGAFDLVTCNPPYVAENEMEALQPEVRDHEPKLALLGGTDGLAFIRRLLRETHPLLKPEGVVILEMADGQAESIRNIAQDTGWRDIRIVKDIAGIERTFLGRRNNDGNV